MQIRPYQEEATRATLSSLLEHDRVLCVMATGGGKTVLAGVWTKALIGLGPVLFLADAKTLVRQAADKLGLWAGVVPSVEQAEHHAMPGDRLVVATTQSIARRLGKWPRNYFRLIIVDEAHRNTLGQQAAAVLGHFSEAQVIGLTATPFRSDKQQLGSFYQHIACEIGLVRLIREGWLARIRVKCVPCSVDLRGTKTRAGDFADEDLDQRISPHIDALAAILKEHAPNRRTVVFTPLVETAKAFAEACTRIGLRATYASGEERAGVEAFARREFDVIANSALLTTGWDEPSVDCVFILRPTKSHTLYSQMVGRGTRLCAGKQDLLLLDPLFLSEGMQLIRPARLIAHTEEELVSVEKRLESDESDLLEAEEKAKVDREESMRKKAEEAAKKKSKEFDAVEFALAIADEELAAYQPVTAWEQQPATPGQVKALSNLGFSPNQITCRGFASKLFDILSKRRDEQRATPKQLKWLIKFRHPNAREATFEEASAFLDRKFGRGKKPAATPPQPARMGLAVAEAFREVSNPFAE
jgi:superfamily II DNA or RNA helicase